MKRLSNFPLTTKPREFVLFISLQGCAKRAFITHRVDSLPFGWMARSSLKRATERWDVSPLERQFSSRIRMGKGISRAIHRKGKMLYRFCCRTASTRLRRSRLLAHRVTSRWSDRSKAEIARLLCVSCQTLYDVLKESSRSRPAWRCGSGSSVETAPICGSICRSGTICASPSASLARRSRAFRHWRSPEGGVDAWESLARI